MQNTEMHVNCSETFDVVTGETIAETFISPDGYVRKFHKVYTIPNGSFSIDPDYQFVQTANMTPIAERSGHWYRGSVSPPPRNLSKPIVELHGDVVFLQIVCHYWHYQHETIMQLLMLRESGELKRILANKSNTTLLVNSFVDCGVPDVFGLMLSFYGFSDLLSKMNVYKIDKKVTYKVVGGDLIMTANGCYHPNLSFLQRTAELSAKSRSRFRDVKVTKNSSAPTPPYRLYIDREEKYKRGIVNRAELLAGLAAYNFTFFSPASHTYTEQREAFARASLVISSSGTAFSANVIHCDPNTTILIELFGKPLHTRTGTSSLPCVQY